MQTKQTRTNLTTASAVIKYCEVPDALAAQVAAQQGVTLSTPGVTWTCCHNADGYHVIVTVDHEARGAQQPPTGAQQHPHIQPDYAQQYADGIEAIAAPGQRQQPTRYDDPTKPDEWTAAQAAYWAQPGDNLFPEFKHAAEAAFQQPGAALQGTQGLTRDAEMDCAAHQQARGAAWQHQAAPTQQQLQDRPMTSSERIERRDKRNNARTVALRNLADAFHQGRAAPTSPSAVGYVESLVAAAELALGDPTAPPPPQKAPWPFPPNPAPNDYGRR